MSAVEGSWPPDRCPDGHIVGSTVSGESVSGLEISSDGPDGRLVARCSVCGWESVKPVTSTKRCSVVLGDTDWRLDYAEAIALRERVCLAITEAWPERMPSVAAATTDRTKPPPGWRGPFHAGSRTWVERHAEQCSLNDAWAIYDREHDDLQSTPADRTRERVGWTHCGIASHDHDADECPDRLQRERDALAERVDGMADISMSDVEKCPICDQSPATDEDFRAIAEGEGDHLCWGGSQCVHNAVDWRTRALAAEKQLVVCRASTRPRNHSGLVEAVERLAKAATPGPWDACLGSGGSVLTALRQRDGAPVCDFLPDWMVDRKDVGDHLANLANLAFVRCVNPQNALRLVERVRVLEAVLREMRRDFFITSDANSGADRCARCGKHPPEIGRVGPHVCRWCEGREAIDRALSPFPASTEDQCDR